MRQGGGGGHRGRPRKVLPLDSCYNTSVSLTRRPLQRHLFHYSPICALLYVILEFSLVHTYPRDVSLLYTYIHTYIRILGQRGRHRQRVQKLFKSCKGNGLEFTILDRMKVCKLPHAWIFHHSPSTKAYCVVNIRNSSIINGITLRNGLLGTFVTQ